MSLALIQFVLKKNRVENIHNNDNKKSHHFEVTLRLTRFRLRLNIISAEKKKTTTGTLSRLTFLENEVF